MTHTTPEMARSAAEVLDRFTAKKDYADFTFVSQSLRSLADQLEAVTSKLTLKDLAIEAMRLAIARQGKEISELKALLVLAGEYRRLALRYRQELPIECQPQTLVHEVDQALSKEAK